MSDPRKSKGIIVKLALLCAVGYIAVTFVRLHSLFNNSRELFAQSIKYPHTYTVGNPQLPPISYVALGDSTTAGTGAATLEDTYVHDIAATLARGGHCVHVTNLGVSGARIKDVNALQTPQLEKLKPDFITVSVGANDATHFTPLDEYQASVRQLIASLKKAHALVFIASAPNLANAPALPFPFSRLAGNRAHRQNIILRSEIGSLPFSYIDLYYRGKLDYQADYSLYAKDLFHPSGNGYEVWAGLFEEKL